MATKGQELKKELTQAFSGLKFSVKTKMVCKGSITEIAVTIKGLKDSDYTISEIKEITNKYHNWDWQTVTGDTNVVVNTDEETKEEIDNPVIETIQETKEEPIDNTVIETVKEVTLQNKIAKLQTKLTRLNAQLRIAKGWQNQHKLVEKILKIEATIEQLEPKQDNLVEVKEKEIEVKDITVKLPVSVSTLKKHCGVPSAEMTDKEIINGWKYSLAAQSMQKDWQLTEQISWADRHLILNIVHWVDQYQQEMDKRGLTEKYCLWIEKKEEIQDEFCKKPDRKTIKLLESRFKDAQIGITETQVILKSETSELTMKSSMELPELDCRRRDVIRSLIKQNQNPKIHSVYEYIGSILLTA